jgi:hypothetical protein
MVLLTDGVACLPIVGGDGALYGALTWKSYAHMMLAGNPRTLTSASDSNPPTVQDNADLFDAVSIIAEHSYVIVRDPQGALRGVVTMTELAIRYRDLLEPFQKIGEIERRLRRCTTARLTATDFQEAFGPDVTDAENLYLSSYRHLLQDPTRWTRFGLTIDRSWFCDLIHAVKEARNELAHFKKDKLDPHQMADVDDLLGLLRTLDPR